MNNGNIYKNREDINENIDGIENKKVNHKYSNLEYDLILNMLKSIARTDTAKSMIDDLNPYTSELELRKQLRDTTEAKDLLVNIGTPPIPNMENIDEYVQRAVSGDLLTPDNIEQIGVFLGAVARVKDYLERGKDYNINLSYYSDNLTCHEDIRENISRTIRGGQVDDYATASLRDIRRKLISLEESIKTKADGILRVNKAYVSDSFVVMRNGCMCIPLKKQYKSKIEGTVIDKSSTGSTLFVEPKSVGLIKQQFDNEKIYEDEEVRRILYTLQEEIANNKDTILENIRVIGWLDFVLSKGKLSIDMNAVEPSINLERRLIIEGGRHPLLDSTKCVPLNFILKPPVRGIVITGPNTGGKTVAMKTVALFSLMACSGLHVPCDKADIAMNSQVLSDIGDGQNISDNLSTFSAHISNILNILKQANEESLVILDEPGSGTDPTEGMGMAIAILEQLRLCKCNFMITTHYPEVKEYSDDFDELVNARMTFDKESLKPLYRLEIGQAGESCALYIARQLGVPSDMLRTALMATYKEVTDENIKELKLVEGETIVKNKVLGIKPIPKSSLKKEISFVRGDSVTVLPEGVIGIVVKPADDKGDVLVQIKKEKILINHKRLKLKVAASMLYPEDYDFSIIFDTVENRKKEHQMMKGHGEGLIIERDKWLD